jgi:DNA-binding transcriptional LysR family regulator
VIEVTKGAERDGEISLIQMPSADQISSLLAGTVDLGFIRGRYRGSGLRSRVVHTERLSVAVPRSYADRLPEQIDDVETLRALEGLTPINYNSGSSEYMYNSVAAFAREPYATNATTVATVGVVLELVADGLGFGFVPETMKESARARGISFHSVNDALFPNLEVSAVWREGSLFTEWVETTVDRVISSWNNGDIGKRGSSE